MDEIDRRYTQLRQEQDRRHLDVKHEMELHQNTIDNSKVRIEEFKKLISQHELELQVRANKIKDDMKGDFGSLNV